MPLELEQRNAMVVEELKPPVENSACQSKGIAEIKWKQSGRK